MKHRNPIVVLLLSFITFGLYAIYWFVVTARELRSKGADIPNAILIIIPIVNIYWQYKYSAGVEQVTNGRFSTLLVFLLFLLTGFGGMLVAQIGINEVAAHEGAGGSQPGQPSSVPQTPPAAGSIPPVNPGVAAGTAVGVASPGVANVTPQAAQNDTPPADSASETTQAEPVTPSVPTPGESPVQPVDIVSPAPAPEPTEATPSASAPITPDVSPQPTAVEPTQPTPDAGQDQNQAPPANL